MNGERIIQGCTLKLQNFEGPFDLLFHLIEKNKINIYDIPINEITDQYMEYLFAMRNWTWRLPANSWLWLQHCCI